MIDSKMAVFWPCSKEFRFSIYYLREGDYKDNKRHGKGRIISAAGKVTEQEWKNGVLQ